MIWIWLDPDWLIVLSGLPLGHLVAPSASDPYAEPVLSLSFSLGSWRSEHTQTLYPRAISPVVLLVFVSEESSFRPSDGSILRQTRRNTLNDFYINGFQSQHPMSPAAGHLVLSRYVATRYTLKYRRKKEQRSHFLGSGWHRCLVRADKVYVIKYSAGPIVRQEKGRIPSISSWLCSSRPTISMSTRETWLKFTFFGGREWCQHLLAIWKRSGLFSLLFHTHCVLTQGGHQIRRSRKERERKRELPNTKQMLSAPGLLATRSIGSSAAAKAGEKEENGDEKTWEKEEDLFRAY